MHDTPSLTIVKTAVSQKERERMRETSKISAPEISCHGGVREIRGIGGMKVALLKDVYFYD